DWSSDVCSSDLHAYPARVRRDIAAVTLDDLVLRAGTEIARRDAVVDDEIHEHDDEEDQREDERGHGLRRQERAPGVREADVFEPEIVGVEPRETAQTQQQEDECDGRDDEPATQAERTSTALDRRNSHLVDIRSRVTVEAGARFRYDWSTPTRRDHLPSSKPAGARRHLQPGCAGGRACPVGNCLPFTFGSSAL